MKSKILFFYLLSLLYIWVGCNNKSSSNHITIPDGVIVYLDAQEGTTQIKIESNEAWKATSSNSWCVVETPSGEGNGSITISYDYNVADAERFAGITIVTEKSYAIVSVYQSSDSDHSYEIPVVFQVLYKDPSSSTQNPRRERLDSILTAVNQIYQNTGLQFVMATHDPNGNTMTEAGIRRIEWSGDYPFDFEKFADNAENKKYMWDFNEYVNIFLLESAKGNQGAAGMAKFPILNKQYPLAGCEHTAATYLTVDNLDYVHALFIDNGSINIHNQDFPKEFNPNCPVYTIAHELGHYLSLQHVFSQTDNEDDCQHTDYCNDTYTYNRKAYTAYREKLINEGKGTFDLLKLRTDCSGNQYTSFNIMDYDEGWYNQITPDQKERIRHTLRYSVTTPGPKALDRVKTKLTDTTLIGKSSK